MATPSVMIRFSDEIRSIDEHNKVFKEKGAVLWGLWLKSFENKDVTLAHLNGREIDRIYIADTLKKSNPSIYVCDVKRIITKNSDVDDTLIPEYYRKRKDEVPIWFELASKIGAIDADKKLTALLGVPTIYFLDYDERGGIINAAPQRRYDLEIINENACWALLLSDIHLGDDHAFRYPGAKPKADINSQRTLSEVLCEDLKNLGAIHNIGCVVVSGDILTRGGWSKSYRTEDKELSGLELAKLFLSDLSKAVSVDRRLFLMVPGNHDIVRKGSDPTEMQEMLLHYSHEEGFRTLREEFCDIYKLSPLNYVARLVRGKNGLLIGMLNSAYLNEQTEFSEYGYVGDDADEVFKILEQEESEDVTKMVVLHHHLLPVYEQELIAASGKISVTLDAVKLLRRAQETGVSTIIHGHQHSTKRMIFSANSPEMNRKSRDAGRFITIIAAGSSGVKRERLPNDETNAYALIKLDSKNPTVRMRRIYSDGRLGEDW